MKNKINILKLVSIAILIVVFVIIIYFLNKPIAGQVPTAASKFIFVPAHVTKIIRDDAYPDTWTEGLRLGTQELYVKLDGGQHKGLELPAVNYLNAYSNIDVKVNTKVIVRLDYDSQSKPYVASIANYNRSIAIIFLVIVFVTLILVFGRKKGLSALLSLIFTIICIWYMLIPMIQRGVPAILATIILVLITTTVSMFMLNGYSSKAFCASIASFSGVLIAGLIAYIVSLITPINGFNMPEAEDLILRSGNDGLKISGMLISGILISSLGAVMDITMGMTSAVYELYAVNPNMKRKELFKFGLNVGRDTMGTMVNTLILAFAGASLNMLILFRIFDYPYIQIFNSDLMTIEILQSLAGTIGVVLTVPIVAALSSTMCRKNTKKSTKNIIRKKKANTI